MKIFAVTSQSDTSALAEALIQVIKENSPAHIQAFDEDSVRHALNALVMTQRKLAEKGVFIKYKQDLVNVTLQGQDGKAVQFTINHSLTPPAVLFEEITINEMDLPALIGDETALDYLAATADSDAVRRQTAGFTQDEEIAEMFADRQDLAYSGRKELIEKLETHHAESPALSGGDLDAGWDQSDVGEETVGGMNPTPDQDRVDEIGEALGITYEDDEPLHTGEMLERRDRDRWELDPASAENEDEPE